VSGTNVGKGAPISFGSPEFQKECRFAAYDRLRNEAPVYRDPLTGNYVLTRYADIRAALINHKVFSSDAGMVGTRVSPVRKEVDEIYLAKGPLPGRNLQTYDPPEHKVHRAPVDRAFDRWNVMALNDFMREVSNKYIDAFIDKGKVEFVKEFAELFPLHIIADQLGLPVEDSPRIKLWADTAVEEINPVLTPEREIEIAHILAGMYEYFQIVLERMRRSPDNRLVSKIVQTVDPSGNPLDMSEMLEVMRAIVVAAGDTTTLGLGGGMRLLIENPQAAVHLRDNPKDIAAFVEETLRIVSPVQTLFRRTREDFTLHGVTIPKGAIVEVRYGAGNLDPEKFECPRRLDINRNNAKAHLAFGVGEHICLGMQLARAEMNVAFETILARMENFGLVGDSDGFEETPSYIANGPTRLYMTFDRRV